MAENRKLGNVARFAFRHTSAGFIIEAASPAPPQSIASLDTPYHINREDQARTRGSATGQPRKNGRGFVAYIWLLARDHRSLSTEQHLPDLDG